MIAPEPIGLWNTGMPLVVLCAMALLLPRLVIDGQTRSQREVMMGVLITAIVTGFFGAVLFAGLYVLRGAPVGAAFGEAPLASVLFFARLSALTALAWLPLLALVWFYRAQRVEALKGEDLARPERAS